MRALVLEELLDKVQNRFLLAVSAAKRARQIRNGSKKLIDAPEDESTVIIALDEILEDKIKIEIGEIKGEEPKKIDGKKVIKAKEKDKKEEKETKAKAEKKTKASKKPVKGKKKKKSRSMAA